MPCVGSLYGVRATLRPSVGERRRPGCVCRGVTASRVCPADLRFFLSTDKTSARIRSIHSISEGRQDKNIEKQAKQIAYSIRQAEQYFRASSLVDLTTRPLLLYYGAVSLSQALILLKNDGTYSLDVSRKLKRHRHHGLDLHGTIEAAAKAKSFREFWESITCSVHKKESGEFWGHFPVFYRSLDPDVFSYKVQIQNSGQTSYLTQEITFPSADPRSIEAIAAQPFNAYGLLKTLPDMYTTLIELQQQSDLRPGNIKRTVINFYRQITDTTAPSASPLATRTELERTSDSSDFFIDRISETEQNELVAFYQGKNPVIVKRSNYPTNLYLNLTIQTPAGTPQNLGYYPDIVGDVSGNKFYILKPEQYVSEAAVLQILLFALGMVSRYYPDIWIKNIDTNIEMAEVTNAFVNLTYRKFPNLILDQMTGIKHAIKS